MKKSNKLSRLTWVVAAALFAVPGASWAATIHFEGFENPYVSGGNNWNGPVTQVSTNTNGIASSTGVFHATVATGSGSFSRLGGYSNDFDGGFTVSQDIFLDTNWSNGQGFDFSTAVSDKSPNDHLRDFIWHVGVVGGNLLVNANNNTDFSVNAFVLQSGNNFNFTTAGATTGWYTFETVFRDNGVGALAVDFNLYNSASSLLYTVTSSDPSDLLATVVGGNRYAWFTINTVDGLAIDNTHLESAAVVPIPAAAPLGLLGMGLIGLARKLRKKSA